jgi:hypothetical protein
VFGSPAKADDKQVCSDGYEKSQSLRDDGKLLKSREQLRLCARASCAAFITKTCTDWLSEVEQRIPSIVLSAKSGAGADLIDVRVTMDGVALTNNLDGRAVEVDPGAHTFVFESAGERVEERFAVKESAKGQLLSVTIGKPPSGSTPASIAATEATGASSSDASATSANSTSTLRYVGYGIGGLGVIALGVGALFGLQASSKLDDSTKDPGGDGCDTNDFCGAGGKQARKDAQSAATLSTIGFIAGGTLLAAGVALVVFAPSNTKASAHLAPALGLNTAGMLLGARF